MKKNIKFLLSALAVTVLSGSAFAGTYDYFKIHAKNITPVYTSETIQIEGAAETAADQEVPADEIPSEEIEKTEEFFSEEDSE